MNIVTSKYNDCIQSLELLNYHKVQLKWGLKPMTYREMNKADECVVIGSSLEEIIAFDLLVVVANKIDESALRPIANQMVSNWPL